jgi:nucleotide-binding universal stress UspA family protein
MTLYDRILVPTDGSAEGRRAVAHALDLASVHGADVHGLYVVDTASYAGMPMESSWEGVSELLREDAEKAAGEVESLAADTGLDAETAVAEGSPSKEIIRYAEANGCDLIVMGTHGRGGIDRLLLGSVAEKVVRGSSVPVLTVRLDGEVPRGETDERAVESGTPADREGPAESGSGADGESEATGQS